MKVIGMKEVIITLGEGEFTRAVVDDLPMEALLGMDFILLNECILDPAKGRMEIRSKQGMTVVFHTGFSKWVLAS